MIKVENQYLRSAILTIVFYVLLLITSYLLDIVSPSGPCAPGLGAAIVLGLPFISGVMVVKNLIQYFAGNRIIVYSLLIHSLILLSLFIYIKSL